MFGTNNKNFIVLNMAEGSDNLIFLQTPYSSFSTSTIQTKIINWPNYKKKSSGLSNGAIAGINLTCAVVFIYCNLIIFKNISKYFLFIIQS